MQGPVCGFRFFIKRSWDVLLTDFRPVFEPNESRFPFHELDLLSVVEDMAELGWIFRLELLFRTLLEDNFRLFFDVFQRDPSPLILSFVFVSGVLSDQFLDQCILLVLPQNYELNF